MNKQKIPFFSALVFLILSLLFHVSAYYYSPLKPLPRIVAVYYINTPGSEFESFMKSPEPADAVMVAAFDLITGPILECEKIGFESCINHNLISRVHDKGLILIADISNKWGEGKEALFWKSFERSRPLLIALIKAGVDGIDFDEYLDSDRPETEPVKNDSFDKFRRNAQQINDQVIIISTEYEEELLFKYLYSGMRSTIAALSWYTVDPEQAELQFLRWKDRIKTYGARSGFWVDRSTLKHSQRILDRYDTLFLWNLCWKESVTCKDLPPETTWVSWEIQKKKLLPIYP